MGRVRRSAALLFVAAALTTSAPHAEPLPSELRPSSIEPSARAAKRELAKGRPDGVLDRLDFPREVQGWWVYKKHRKKVLKREVRRVEWGAGTGNRIEYRFAVTL